MAKLYRKPNIANMIRESSRLLRVDGTEYKLAVPFSLQYYGGHNKFNIGRFEFHVHGDRVVCNEPLPASWLVNLNAQEAAA